MNYTDISFCLYHCYFSTVQDDTINLKLLSQQKVFHVQLPSLNLPHHFTFQFLFASTPRQWNL